MEIPERNLDDCLARNERKVILALYSCGGTASLSELRAKLPDVPSQNIHMFLTKLVDKKVIEQRSERGVYVYYAKYTHEDACRALLNPVLNSFTNGTGTGILNMLHGLGFISETDIQQAARHSTISHKKRKKH